MKCCGILLAIAGISITLQTHPAWADTMGNSSETSAADAVSAIIETDPFYLKRAQNLARAAAEVANGGLNVYRAETSMHASAIAAPFELVASDSLVYTFRGYRPWDIDTNGTTSYFIESVVRVTPTGEVTLEYNGPIR